MKPEDVAVTVLATLSVLVAFCGTQLGSRFIDPAWGGFVGLLAAFGAEVALFVFGAMIFGIWSSRGEKD